jgi:Protein of unknown function (DUF4197)
MKRLFFAFSILTTMIFSSCDELSKIATTAGGPGLTNEEAGTGIKEALGNGLVRAVLNLNKEDGFFGSQFYKMLLPPDAVKVEKALRNIGMGKTVDKAILSINRGAEDAVGYAKPIFVNAIKGMSLMDAINIVRGDKNAATNYFKEKTTAALIAAFSPVVKTSLDRVDATKYYGDIINTYNKLPTVVNKVNPDLTSFVVGKATDALFDQIAKEEEDIRANPIARTTDILKKVFGQKW